MTPLFFAGVVLQENHSVFVTAAADRARVPGSAKLRDIRRLLAQPVTLKPRVKLAIAQVICVMQKAMDRREITHYLVKLRAEVSIIQFRRWDHLKAKPFRPVESVQSAVSSSPC
jgi:hypothetical protein